jgi:hypothetical protein
MPSDGLCKRASEPSERQGLSELARRVAPMLKNSRFGRDNITKYMRGKVLPLPHALEAIAKVLGCKSEDLLPGGRPVNPATAYENAPRSFRDIGGDQVWVHINMALHEDVAWEIARLTRCAST